MRVVLEYLPTCRKCDALIEELSALAISLDFEFVPLLLDSGIEGLSEQGSATRVMSEEWINMFGSEKQKELHSKAKNLFKMLSEGSIAPVLRIEWFDGKRNRELVIKGFTQDKNAFKNLVKTIKSLQELERGVIWKRF
ncbi:MAG: hypothetical protein QW734_05330 [Candidatus Bathyarchaeia archaeon]